MTLSSDTKNRLGFALANQAAATELDQALSPGTTGTTFYVDSGTAAGTGANSARRAGTSSAEPFATLAYAISRCTANNGDRIILMPGHNEGFGDAQLDLNVAGVTIIGLGHGPARPRFDFDHANASINIGASGIALRNITLLPSVTDVLVGIDVETLFTDTLLEDIEALPGEDGAGVDDFALVVDLKVGCTRTTVRRLKVRQHASAAGYIAGIRLTGASDDILIEDPDIWITGAGVVAPINGLTTLSTKVRILRGTLVTDAEPGIEMLTGTTGTIEETRIFSDLATIDAATVADGMAHFDVKYAEVGNEAGTLVKTESVDD